MSTLHDRLADLAQEAPTPAAAPGAPTGLWERGRRYRRVRRAGTLAVLGAAVVVLALLGSITWQRAAPPVQPAGGPVGLPDRVWNPSPWLPSTDRPGQLVAMATAEEGSWTGTRTGVAGISATTGEYTFVDLPDAALDVAQDPVLAPDGRHVAYWVSGETTGTPLSRSGPVTGVAICDLESGRVDKHWIRTAHGVRPDFLTWADETTVVWSAGQIDGGDDASLEDQSTGRFGVVESWSLGGRPSPVPGAQPGAELLNAAHGRILVDTGSSRPGRQYRLLDLHHPAATRHLGVPESAGSTNGLPFVSLDQSGRRMALVPGSRTPGKVKAGPVGDLRVVPNTRGTFGVADWPDADTIVTLRRVRDHSLTNAGLYRVSIPTGRSTRLVSFPRLSFGGGWQFATDLLDAPSVHADRPPRPLDPRWVTGAAVATVLAAVAGLVLWRRRVRP